MTQNGLNFAVLGAGNGGQAMAAYLAIKGYDVCLYNRSYSRIEPIIKEGGIHLKGVCEGFGKVKKVTTNIEEAITDAEIIMVVTPAVAHKSLAEELSSSLQDGQVIILNPGRTGGALEFSNILKKKKCNADIIIVEAQTFLFASRVVGRAQAKIYGMKNKVAIAALPSNRIREIPVRLFSIFPQFFPVENVLKTSLDNMGSIFHPAPTLLNMAWIESTGGKFSYYVNGITPSVAKILEELDQERMSVAYSVGVEPISAQDWLRLSYGVNGRNLYEMLQNNQQYFGITAPSTVNHRYVFEDVPMSLVPIASLGKKFNIRTGTIEMIVNLANIVYETDFWKRGRTVESLGLYNLSKKEILQLVNKGRKENVKSISRFNNTILDNMVYNNYADEFQKEAE